MLAKKTEIADITFLEQNIPSLSQFWQKRMIFFLCDQIVFCI